MAIANLHETILAYKMRENQLTLNITEYQDQKSLAIALQGDLQLALNAEKSQNRDFYKNLFEEDQELQDKYLNYTEIPDFEEAIDKITAKFQQLIDEQTAWETILDAQITTDSTEREEVKAYRESLEGMLSSNIQDDFDYSLS